MRKGVFKRTAFDLMLDSGASIIFTLLVIVAIVIGLRETEISSRAEGLRLLEDSLMRAVIQNYAIKGVYPDSIRTIEERYGVYIDRTRYVVHYRIFASNILPVITVLELNREWPK